MYNFQTSLGVASTALVLGSQLVSASPAIDPNAHKTVLEARDDSSTWHTTLEIGSSQVSFQTTVLTPLGLTLISAFQWHIGDAISQHFEDNYMKKICSSTGCDGGSPMSFKYLTSTDGISSLGTGTITMQGNSDNNIAVIDQMLDAVEAALVASSDCKFNVKAQHCANNPGPSDDTWTKRETAGIALDCGDIEL